MTSGGPACPELALTYYKAEGFPIPSVREYIMTVLNSNFEDWRRANPDADIESFKFSPKKLNPAGSLFDYAKLVDVSKNVISRMSAEDVYAQLLEWAKEFDTDFAAKLEADPDYAKRILAIGRGGKKPRKDLAVWKDAKPYMGFFYDEYLEAPVWDEKFSKTVIRDVLERFLNVYDFADDSAAWFAKVKEITEAIGFTTDMKAYKANPCGRPSPERPTAPTCTPSCRFWATTAPSDASGIAFPTCNCKLPGVKWTPGKIFIPAAAR